jgi:branched-chain amino acid transport system ATP-binding protein
VSLLEVEGLEAGYGPVTVVRDLAFSVDEGQVVTILGANGAGKTTTLRALSGVARASGRVDFDGAGLIGRSPEAIVRRGIAHVPEGRGNFAELTVEENLRLGGLWRADRADAAAAMAEVYELFEPLTRRRSHLGHQLSGGERQMLALGRALIARPSLLLLDEPSLGLAPKVTSQIMALLKQLRDNNGLTVLLVEQNVRSALSIADQGVVMSLGRVVMSTSAAQLRDDESLRHAYLGF